MENFDSKKVQKRGIFNEDGDIALSKRKLIQGNTTNLNDFNNLKYGWTMDWYRQSMNNFWIPEEISLSQDRKDYENISEAERFAFDRFISSMASLDSIQTSNVPNLQVYVTANEVNLCLSFVTFQEAMHNQAISYILANITDSQNADYIMHLYENDEKLSARNKELADAYTEFLENNDEFNFVKNLFTNYVIEGIYFSSAYAFFYSLGQNGKVPGIVNEIRHINRDENKHLELFKNTINDFRSERPDLFTADLNEAYRKILSDAIDKELAWADYLIGDNIQGLDINELKDYIKYLGNEGARALGLESLYAGYREIPASMRFIEEGADLSASKKDFIEEKVSSHTSSSFIEDDL